jgi:radical SAM family uncharacterized protein
MTTVNLPHHLLQSVEKPARYTGGEWNSVQKIMPDAAAQALRPFLRFAFCFPDTYEIGMSNLALRILYHLVNERPDAWCERVFAPWTDMADGMRRLGLPLFSLESRTPVSEFDIVGFTLQYELCYTTVLEMLDLAGIPLRSADRIESHPLVIAGGPVTFNIEPMADFFDIVMIGEGEEMLGELLDCYSTWKAGGKQSKAEFLLQAAQIEGVYVPSFYDVTYHEDGTVATIKPNRPGVPAKVRKRIVMNLDAAYFPTQGIVPNTEIVHDRIFLELFRGCTRGCRFCQAGMIYRPVREKSTETLVAQALELEKATGYDEVGMLSLSTSDYSALSELTDDLLGALTPHHTSISLPSLRLDNFSLELMEKASRTRKGGLTFAPEAGTQRLRDVINKNITEDDLLNAMELALRGGWSGAKLYFMLGLPTETLEDVEGIARLVKAIEARYNALPRFERPRKLELSVSTAMFIPKPFTPFQWVAQADIDTLRQHQIHLKDLMRSRSVKYNWHEPKVSYLEAVLARGDRRLGPVIQAAWNKGARFDAWDELFKLDIWLESLAEAGLDPAFYSRRERPRDEVFPWDHIDCGVSREFLWNEYQQALAAATTPECRVTCSACGAQSFGGGVCFGESAASSTHD